MSVLIRAGLAASLLCSLVGSASAATYAITAQNSSDGNLSLLSGNSPDETRALQGANANRFNEDANQGQGAQEVGILYTSQFYIAGHPAGTPQDNAEFRAFCIQYDQSVVIPALNTTNPADYERTVTHLDGARRDLLATLFFNEFDPNGTPDHQSAFQLAIWRIVHGDIGSGAAFDLSADLDQNVTTGGYTNYDLDDADAQIADGWRQFNGGAVWAELESMMEGLDGDGTNDYAEMTFDNTNLSFLTSPTSQNLIIVPEETMLTAVPLPAGLLLMLSGLGALLGRRRV